MLQIPPRTAARAAYAAAGLNLLAALAMPLLLAPGLPVADSLPADRLAYLAAHTARWWAGWLVWHAAAIALLGFYLALAGRWGPAAPWRCALTLLCATAGLAVDLAAEAVYMGVAPRLGPEAFGVAEAAAGLLTGYVGNGLYTVAGILLTSAGAAELPRGLVALAVPVWLAGLALSAATLAGWAVGQLVSTAVLMPTFVVWAFLVGRWLDSRAS
jgi:hypothetical protein